MALSKNSKFYYGLTIDDSNQFLDYREGDATLFATLSHGSYTFASFMVELTRAMNGSAGQIYSCSVDRTTRLVTISADDEFELLSLTGIHKDSSVFGLLGADLLIDLSDENSYTFADPCGFEYVTQFPLQSYIPFHLNKKPIDAVKNKTAGGVIQAVSFGIEKRMECEMLFITDIAQPLGGPVTSNQNGVLDVTAFLDYAVTAAELEFMEDADNPLNYNVCVLDSTEEDSNGLGYRLTEEFDKDLPEYFRSGKLTWLMKEIS